MAPLTYKVMSKHVDVKLGATLLGQIKYREAWVGWRYAPLNSTYRTPSRSTWTEVIPDIETYLKGLE